VCHSPKKGRITTQPRPLNKDTYNPDPLSEEKKGIQQSASPTGVAIWKWGSESKGKGPRQNKSTRKLPPGTGTEAGNISTAKGGLGEGQGKTIRMESEKAKKGDGTGDEKRESGGAKRESRVASRKGMHPH